MGCDIHMFVEYKCGNGMPWQADDHHVLSKEGDHTEAISATGRNYDLFGLLASVRGDGTRKPLGLPDDVSDVVNKASEQWGTDGHSHSYLSIEEFSKILFEEYNALYAEDGNGHSYTPTKRKDIFWSYDDPKYTDYKKHPPDFTSIIPYCEKLKEKKSLDKLLLGKDVTSEVQVRLVFWFDN